MNRKILLLLLVIGWVYRIPAQTNYATTELQKIGEMLQWRGCELSSPGTFPMPSGSSFHFYELRKDETGKIIHLGVPVLNREMTVKKPSLIYDFVERYLLLLSLLPEKERMRNMKDDHIILDFNKSTRIEASHFFQLASDEKGFHLTWTDAGKHVCSMDFPKNIQLIYGKNKIEIEKDFLSGLNLMPEHTETSVDFPLEDNVSLSSDSTYYIYKGNYYILREINSDTYFVRDNQSKLIPLYDANHPSETISNLFSSLLEGEFVLNVTQRMYGREKMNYAVSYSKFYNYCMQTGCQPYIGIESVDDKSVKATVVYENNLYGYNHLLYVEVDLNVLKNKTGIINAEMYCYIPTHNLKSLFQLNEMNYEN